MHSIRFDDVHRMREPDCIKVRHGREIMDISVAVFHCIGAGQENAGADPFTRVLGCGRAAMQDYEIIERNRDTTRDRRRRCVQYVLEGSFTSCHP